MNGLGIIALCTGAIELVYVLAEMVFRGKNTIRLRLLLLLVALYNLYFYSSESPAVWDYCVSIFASFLFLDHVLSKDIVKRRSNTFKNLVLGAVTVLGFGVMLIITSTVNGTSHILPFLLAQYVLLISMMKLILSESTQPGENAIIYTYIIATATMGGFFLIRDKSFASYLVTNTFFLLLITESILLNFISKLPGIEPVHQELQKPTLDEFFESWQFTPTEKVIAQLLLEGKETEEIAALKFVAEGTVRKHVSNLTTKAGVKKREQFRQKVHNLMSVGNCVDRS